MTPTHLGADEVRESHLRAVKLINQHEDEGLGMSKEMRNRLERVVSQNLERHITDRVSDYNAFSLAACAHKLVKLALMRILRIGRKSTFQAIEKEAIIKLRKFDPQGPSNLLWAFAKAEEKAPKLFQAVYIHLQNNPGLLEGFKPQNISNVVWAFAKAGEKAPKLFQAVNAHLQSDPGLLGKFKPQELSNVVWAFAKAEEKAPKLFQAVDAHLQSDPGLLDRFKPQNIANVVCSFAKAGEKASKLSEAVYAHLQSDPGLLVKFNPQDFSNLLWAFATAKEKASKLVKAVDAHLQSNPGLLEGFKPQNISNLVWSFATAKEKAPELFEAVDAHLQSDPELLEGFAPQNISNLVWAYATAGEKAPRLFEAFDAHLQSHPGLLEGFTPQNISNLLWAYAEQRHDAHGLFDIISKHLVVQRLDEYSPQGLSMALRAYAVLYRPLDDIIIQATLQRAVNEPSAFTSQALANIMNAAVVFEKLDAETLKALASAMASMELHEEAYCSVFQSCLGVQLISPDSSPAPLLPGPVHNYAKRLWQERAKASHQPALQNNVLNMLREEMGLKCHPEWMTPDWLFSVDIMVELPAPNNDEDAADEDKRRYGSGNGGLLMTRVAVEVDGPFRFTSTHPFRALGPTLLRRRLLEARVDRVASVPFYDWNAAKSASAKKKLLERLII